MEINGGWVGLDSGVECSRGSSEEEELDWTGLASDQAPMHTALFGKRSVMMAGPGAAWVPLSCSFNCSLL